MHTRIVVALLCALPAAGLWASDPDTGLPELAGHLYTYEPTYFSLEPFTGQRPLNAKFQLSFAVRAVQIDSAHPNDILRPDGLYFAYSQTSFWDLEDDSKPFYDSSYRPELWWHVGLPTGGLAESAGLEPGIGHESNGRAGLESRSINHAFIRTQASWRWDQATVVVEPRARAYLEKSDNPDIAVYRGYVDLQASVVGRNSWGAAVTGRIGSHADRGSLQAELTHPLSSWSNGHVQGFLYLQTFLGWSETLLSYDQRTAAPRILLGYAITR